MPVLRQCILAFSLLMLHPGGHALGRELFVSQSGLHVSPYTNWTNAATNIHAAVAVATDGDTVTVTDGVFVVTSQVPITNGITLRSLNGRDATTVAGGHPATLNRCFYLSHSNAVIRGFAITNGWLHEFEQGAGVLCEEGGLVEDCTFTGNFAWEGGGVALLEGGHVRNCTFTGNYYTRWGSGAYLYQGGIIESCTFTDNEALREGGGVFLDSGGTVVGSSFTGNRAIGGGAVRCRFGGEILDCLVSGNTAWSVGGGCVLSGGATASNCTFSGNHSDWAGGGMYSEGGCVLDCDFLTNVASVGGGLCQEWDWPSSAIAGCTFTGNTSAWGGAVFSGPLSEVEEAVSNMLNGVSALADAFHALDNVAFTLTNMLSGLPGGPQTVPPPGSAVPMGCPGAVTSLCEVGAYAFAIRDCVLTDNSAECGGGFFLLDTPTVAVINCLVSNNTAVLGGGLLGQNAGGICGSTFLKNEATSLGGGGLVVDAGLVSGCTVVSNTADNAGGGWLLGVFDISSVTTNIVNVFGMSLSDTELLRIEGSRLSGNSAGTAGGGLMLGGAGEAVSNWVWQNSAPWGGGIGNFVGDVSHCTLVANTGSFGGGLFAIGGNTADCTANENFADQIGGGVAAFYTGGGGVVRRCLLTGNYAEAGGGLALLDAFDADTCSIASNTAGIAGGGVFAVYGGSLESSLVHDNLAADGGGTYCLNGGGIINNTITANEALNSAGGLFVVTNAPGGPPGQRDATIVNSIIHGNSASNSVNYLNIGDNITYSYTCTFPPIAGTGNITNLPLFAGAAGRDYHLQPSSPCIDAGSNGLMSFSTDLDGLSRPLDGDNDGTATVDMGCYEHLNRAADSDGDSMPDGWEDDHGLNLVADDSAGDADGDTINNGGEYAADTDPQDWGSVLSILDISPEMGGIRIDWKGGREAWQFLECRSNLVTTGEQWTAILAVPPPTPMTNAVIDLGAEGQSIFYRLRAQR